MKNKSDLKAIDNSRAVLEENILRKRTPIPSFEWPEFVRETDRIKNNTEKYKDLSIEEAFANYFGFKLKKSVSVNCGVYQDVQPGDIIPLQILSVNKKGVVFDQGNFKETIICNTNLYQYPRFKDFLPNKPVNFKIIKRTNSTIVVDPFSYMYDEWINTHTKHIEQQYNVNQVPEVLVEGLHLVRGGYMGRVRVDNVSDFCGKDMYVPAFIPGSQIVLNIEYNFEYWEGKTVSAFITGYSEGNSKTDNRMILSCSVKERLRHLGNLNIINIFKHWTENSDTWKNISGNSMEGKITGVCHTSNKCGAFVELPEYHITAMVPCTPDELSNFRRGDTINVKFDSFEEPLRWNGLQMEHIAPYVIENDILKHCNIRVILKAS